MNTLDLILFGVYPYVALAIFVFGLIFRFRNAAYSVSSKSSLLIDDSQLRLGNIFFHVGILGLLAGHTVGLLTPISLMESLGISHSAKQIMAMLSGTIFGSSALIGVIILLRRRIVSEKVRAHSLPSDYFVLVWLLLTLITGMLTIFMSFFHLDGHQMVLFMTWAQHIVTLQGDAHTYLADVNWGFKLHMCLGLTVFVIFPFTRLAHAVSGLLTVLYIGRSTQITRSVRS